MSKKTTWRLGDKAELARRAGFSRQYLDLIVRKKQSASANAAKRFAAAAGELGLPLKEEDFLAPRLSTSSLINP